MTTNVDLAPPVPRPFEPPVSSLPPGARPASYNCFEAYGGRDVKQLLDAVRDVARSEWDRLRGGPPTDQTQQEVWLSELVAAMQSGHVIPGFYRDAESNGCYMDWAELACWSRWYGLLEGTYRDVALDELAAGNASPWTAEGTQYDWLAPPEPCAHEPPSDEQRGCCPSEVRLDPRYAVGQGQFPGDGGKPSGSSVGMVILVGAAAVLALTAVVLARRSEQSQTA